MRKPALLTVIPVLLAAAPLVPSQEEDREVVVYVSMDQAHSQRILDRFEKRSGIDVLADYDTEASKTVGLVNKLLEQKDAPKADVYWNNEVGQSVRLKREGVLRPYVSPRAAGIPDTFKDPEGYWTGFAARARVLIYNKEMVSGDELPRRLEQLAEPRFAERAAMAKPLTGTTLTHIGALYAVWGPDRTEAWLARLRENGIRWEAGNAQVMRTVAGGSRAFGLTDTDDAFVARQEGKPVSTIFLDQGEEGLGNLVIPNTVMAVRGGPNPREAEELIDFLLSPEVERMLAEGTSAQIPLHSGVPTPEHVVSLESIRPMEVDYAVVGTMITEHFKSLEDMFSGGGSGTGLVYAALALVLIVLLVIGVRSMGATRSGS